MMGINTLNERLRQCPALVQFVGDTLPLSIIPVIAGPPQCESLIYRTIWAEASAGLLRSIGRPVGLSPGVAMTMKAFRWGQASPLR